MVVKNFLVGTSIVTGLSIGGYLAYIHSLTKYLDELSPEQTAQYFKTMHKGVDKAGQRRLTFAYRAPTVMPSHTDMVATFGEKAIAKQASYVDACGVKKTASVFSVKNGNGSLGSLFALQSLEKATPLLQLRAASLFRDNFQVSAQWRLFLHNRKCAMAEARQTVAAATNLSDASALLDAYCNRVEELTLEKNVQSIPELRLAVMEAACGTTVAASVELTDKETPKPREAELYVFCTAAVPEGVDEGSFNFKVRRACGDWYTRWLAVNATSALTQL